MNKITNRLMPIHHVRYEKFQESSQSLPWRKYLCEHRLAFTNILFSKIFLSLRHCFWLADLKCTLCWRHVASATPATISHGGVHTSKLQTLVYDIIPPTTAINGYVIGLPKLSANSHIFSWWSNGSKFITTETTQTTPGRLSHEKAITQNHAHGRRI